MKFDPRQMLVGLAVAGTLVVAPPAVGYAVGAVDSGIASRLHDTVERSEWVAGKGSLTDVFLDDNDNDDIVDDDAVDNDNDDASDNDNDASTDAVPDGGVDPNPSNNDPNNNGDGDGGNNSGGGDNGGGGSDSSSGVSGDVGS